MEKYKFYPGVRIQYIGEKSQKLLTPRRATGTIVCRDSRYPFEKKREDVLWEALPDLPCWENPGPKQTRWNVREQDLGDTGECWKIIEELSIEDMLTSDCWELRLAAQKRIERQGRSWFSRIKAFFK